MARNKNDLNFTQFKQTLRRSSNPAITQQALTERMYVRILTELAANRFKWEGLPDEIDKRFLELNLFNQALVVFFRDKDTDKFMAMRAASTGMWNYNDNPTKFTAVGNQFGSRELRAFPVDGKPAECVPIWANYLRTPDWDIVSLYSFKLASIDRSIEIAALNMRNTVAITVDENERLSYVNAFKQYVEGQPVIFGTRQFDLSKMQAINLAPHHDTIDRLQIAKTRMWNEAMTYLGINNANQDKKERLVADEVSANDAQVEATKNIALNARKFACEHINTLFGLEVSVEFNVQNPPMPGNDGTDGAGTGGTESDSGMLEVA